MITVLKGNVELTVPEDLKNEYLDMGYDIIENGIVVESSNLHFNDAETALAEKDTEIEKLKEQLAKEKEKLKTANAELKKFQAQTQEEDTKA